MKLMKKALALALSGVMMLSVAPVVTPANVAEAAVTKTVTVTPTAAGDVADVAVAGVLIKAADGDTGHIWVDLDPAFLSLKLDGAGTDREIGDGKDYAAKTNGLYNVDASEIDNDGSGATLAWTALKPGTSTINIYGDSKKINTLATVKVTVNDASVGAITAAEDKDSNDMFARWYKAPTGGTDKELFIPVGTQDAVVTAEVTKNWVKASAGADAASVYSFASSNASAFTATTVGDGVGANAKAKINANTIGSGDLEVSFKKAATDKFANVVKIKVNVVRADGNLLSVKYPNPTDPTNEKKDINALADGVELDTLVNKTATLKVALAEDTPIKYTSENNAVATVDANGVITAVGKGATKIRLIGDPTTNYEIIDETINVVVADTATDIVTAKVGDDAVNDDDKPINLDLSSSTATNAKKTATITAKSLAGYTEFAYALYGDDKATAVAGNSDDTITLKDNVITAGAKKGTRYVKVSTKTSGSTTGGTCWIKVVVNELPEAEFSVDPITLDLVSNKSIKVTPVSSITGLAYTYKLAADADKGELDACVELSGNTVKARAIGKTTLAVTSVATSTYRATTKKIPVTVGAVELAPSDLVAPAYIEVEVGKTASIGASSAKGATITYGTAKDTAIAEVAADGTVTGKLAGTTSVTVSAAATTTTAAGTKEVTIVVKGEAAPTTAKKVSFKNTSKSYKASTLKKGAKSFSVIKASDGGKVTYKVTKGSKKSIKVSTAGKVTVKKGTKKGTYKVKVTVAAKGNYKKTSKTIKITVK